MELPPVTVPKTISGLPSVGRPETKCGVRYSFDTQGERTMRLATIMLCAYLACLAAIITVVAALSLHIRRALAFMDTFPTGEVYDLLPQEFSVTHNNQEGNK